MAHTVMSQPICLHTRRQQRRLATAVRQAALHATPRETVHLRAVVQSVGTGATSIEDARSAVASLRREQSARHTRAA